MFTNRHTILVASLVLGAPFLTACSRSAEPPSPRLDLSPFRTMVAGATCANIRNRLCIIDGSMVLWDRRGDCPDNSYELTLFGATPKALLCRAHDSIAGPQRSCEDARGQAIFDTASEHLDAPDLGLGAEHTVEMIDM